MACALRHGVFVSLCSDWALCSDLIMTGLSPAYPGRSGGGRGGARVRGGVCAALSHQREKGGEGLATLYLEAWVAAGGAHTLPVPSLEVTSPPFTLSGRNLPYRPR